MILLFRYAVLSRYAKKAPLDSRAFGLCSHAAGAIPTLTALFIMIAYGDKNGKKTERGNGQKLNDFSKNTSKVFIA